MIKNFAFSVVSTMGLALSSLPGHAFTSDQFIAAALQRVDELDAQIENLQRQQPQTQDIEDQIAILAGTANQLRSLARIAPSRPESYLHNVANYYQLSAVSGS